MENLCNQIASDMINTAHLSKNNGGEWCVWSGNGMAASALDITKDGKMCVNDGFSKYDMPICQEEKARLAILLRHARELNDEGL